jgi:acyl dehydratase
MTETTASLIPPESLALIGEPLGEPSSATITRKDAQRYAKAADDLNPLYFDEDAAKAAGYRTIIAPPTYLTYATARDGTIADLRPDGLYRGVAVMCRCS